MEKLVASSSYATQGPSDGRSLYDHKNRRSPFADEPSTRLPGPFDDNAAQDAPALRRTRTVRKTPVAPNSGERSARSPGVQPGRPLLFTERKTLPSEGVVSNTAHPARKCVNVGVELEKSIVLSSISQRDGLGDALLRWGRLLQALGHPKAYAQSFIRETSTVNALVKANPSWVWSVAPEKRSIEHYFGLARRFGLNQAVQGVHPSQRAGAKALVQTAFDLQKQKISSTGIPPEAFYASALDKEPSVLRHIPDSLLGDARILREATRCGALALRKDHDAFEKLPPTLRRQPDLLRLAVEQRPRRLREATSALLGREPYQALCSLAVKLEPAVIQFVEKEFLNRAMVKGALRQSPQMVCYIPPHMISEEDWTSLTGLFFDQRDAESLNYVPEEILRLVSQERMRSDEHFGSTLSQCAVTAAPDRQQFIGDLFIQAIEYSPDHGKHVPPALRLKVAEAFPHDPAALFHLIPDPKLRMQWWSMANPPHASAAQENHRPLPIPEPAQPPAPDTRCCSIS